MVRTWIIIACTLLSSASLLGATICHTRPCRPTPCNSACHTIYIPRSSHLNNAYWINRPRPWRIVERRPRIACDAAGACDRSERTTYCEEPIIYTGFDIGLSHQGSFAAEDLARCLFGAATFPIAGSLVVDRPDGALLAEQFGLSPFYEGCVHFTPSISATSLHAQGCWNMYTTAAGHQFFLRGLLTVMHQTRRLYDNDCAESAFQTTTLGGDFPPGDMSAASALAAPSLQAALNGTFVTGDQTMPWCGARLTVGSLHITNLAGFTVDLGYATPPYDCYRSALYLRYRAPTGTHINANMPHRTSLFAPIAGDGAHQELGGGFAIVREFWRDEGDHALVFRCDAYGTHLFANDQIRTFGLKDQGCLSQYLLLKSINPITNTYTGSIVPASCFTTRAVRSYVGGSGEVTLQFMLQSPHVTWSVGYEFFGRTREKVCLRGCAPCASGSFGIKGCTGTYGYQYSVNSVTRVIENPPTPTAFALNSTASASTIVSCGPVGGAMSTETSTSVVVAWNNVTSASATPANAVPDGTLLDTVTIASTSNPPVILTDNDLDLCSGAAPKQVVHKGFITCAHQWPNVCHQPYLMAGVSAEGSGERCSLKQWGIWLQGGCSW